MISSKDRDELDHTITLLAAVAVDEMQPLKRSALHQCIRTLNSLKKKLQQPKSPDPAIGD